MSFNKTERLQRGAPEQEKSQRFVWEVGEYESPAHRITGIRKLRACGLLTPEPMFVLGHSGFEEYKRAGITQELKKQVSEAFQKIRQENPTRGAYIGRAFYVPGVEKVTGPRTAAIYNEEDYLTEVERFFKFAIKEGYDVEGANIAFVFHPFIHAGEPLMVKEPPIEYPGGDVTPLPKEEGVLIRATFGPDEAVQGYPHDEYRIKITGEEIRIRKAIGEKTATLIPHEVDVYEEIQISKDFQTNQTLTNLQIFQIAEAYQRVHKDYGPHRLEFIVQPEGIIFRECLPFEFKPEDLAFLKEKEIISPVIKITSRKDLDKLQPPTAIVFLPAELFKKRSTDLFTLLAAHAKENGIELVVLSHGSIATTHLVRNFIDVGQSVVFVGDEEIRDGELIRIFKEGSLLNWERVRQQEDQIVDLKNVGLRKIDVGGKGENLGKLATADEFLVPCGFCLSTELFSRHLASLGINDDVKSLDTFEGRELQKKIKEIQKTILSHPLPESLIRQIKEGVSQFPSKRFTVRSSANYEDGSIAFAGLFKTFLRVPPDKIPERIKEVWASTFTEKVIRWAKISGIYPSDLKMGIVVHEMIGADKAGITFTIDLFSNLPNFIISAAIGSAERLFLGKEKYFHQLRIKRGTKEVLEEEMPKGPVLTQKEIDQLVDAALRVEEFFGGKPQEIEWAIRNGEIWILQARSF